MRPLPVVVQRVRGEGPASRGRAPRVAGGQRGSAAGGEGGADRAAGSAGAQEPGDGGEHGQQPRLGGAVGQARRNKQAHQRQARRLPQQHQPRHSNHVREKLDELDEVIEKSEQLLQREVSRLEEKNYAGLHLFFKNDFLHEVKYFESYFNEIFVKKIRSFKTAIENDRIFSLLTNF
jgi:hypothetical protein